MALPIQLAPTHRLQLPSNGREVKFRPFLVKEQKYLLMAREANNTEDTIEAITNLIESVTFGEVKVNELTLFDLEYLFLQIRSKSVGETQEMTLLCTDPDCNGTGKAVINFEEVAMPTVPENIQTRFMLNEEVGLELKMPTALELAKIEGFPLAEQFVELLKVSIKNIFDAENVYQRVDLEEADIEEFVNNLPLDQVEVLSEFFDEMPQLTHELRYVCGSCNKESVRELRGLQSFF